MLKKVRDVLHRQLRQGLTVHHASLAVALGLVGGIFPIIGCTTIVCMISAFIFRLNQPIALAVNFLAVIPKLALIIPFLRFGEFLFRAEPISFEIKAFTARWMAEPLLTTQTFAMSFVHAIVAWLVVAPFLFVVLYFIVRPIIERTARASQAVRSRVSSKH